jgi:hypothetical protein
MFGVQKVLVMQMDSLMRSFWHLVLVKLSLLVFDFPSLDTTPISSFVVFVSKWGGE